MGNFYANVILRELDLESVTSAVAALKRRAYVAKQGNATVVFDEGCDRQDTGEIERLAAALSKRLGCTALAFCNHDDDVLWYVLVDGGRVLDRYDSFPGYFDSGPEAPKGGDAARLSAAFGVAGREPEIAALLQRKHREVRFEIDRHSKLLELLELPTDLGVLGYGYVSRGELASAVSGGGFRAVGGAPEPDAAEAPPSRADDAAPQLDPKTLAALQAEGAEVMIHAARLAFNTVDVPDRFAAVLGSGRTSGYTLLLRLQRYIQAKKLAQPLGMVRADAVLADILGEQEFHYLALARLVARAFDVPPLDAADRAAFESRDAAIMLRFAAAMRRATEDK